MGGPRVAGGDQGPEISPNGWTVETFEESLFCYRRGAAEYYPAQTVYITPDVVAIVIKPTDTDWICAGYVLEEGSEDLVRTWSGKPASILVGPNSTPYCFLPSIGRRCIDEFHRQVATDEAGDDTVFSLFLDRVDVEDRSPEI